MANDPIGDVWAVGGSSDLPEVEDRLDSPSHHPSELSSVREIHDGDLIITSDMPEWPDAFREVEEEMRREQPDPLQERRRAIAWASWAIVESALEVARGLDDPDDLDRSMDSLVAILRRALGDARFRTSLPRLVITPDRTGRLVMRQHKGGRSKGWLKGKLFTRRENLEWWLAWDLDDDPRREDYAAAIGVKDPETALGRWYETGLSWPPTTAQLDEIDDDQ